MPIFPLRIYVNHIRSKCYPGKYQKERDPKIEDKIEDHHFFRNKQNQTFGFSEILKLNNL